MTCRSLLALGITDGILPCPSALVVLLVAISPPRIGFSTILILAFSLGLAAVLTAIGTALVKARQLLNRVLAAVPALKSLLVASAFTKLVPEHAAAFRTGYQGLAGALERLHRMALSVGGDLLGEPLVVSHSFLDYFARRYALNLKSLHRYHGSVPDGIQWEELKTFSALMSGR